MATAEIERYWKLIVRYGCITLIGDDLAVACGAPAEIAHCHGGSIVERMQEPKAKGRKLPRYDWLVLPICPHHHRLTTFGLDHGPLRWEQRHGPQAVYLDHLIRRTGVDVWARARRP
jgi:hypothetical protein